MVNFLKNAFRDMKESAKAQHKVDKANFAAAKAEARASWEEAKVMGSSSKRKAMMQKERKEAIAKARKRQAQAEARFNAAKLSNKIDG